MFGISRFIPGKVKLGLFSSCSNNNINTLDVVSRSDKSKLPTYFMFNFISFLEGCSILGERVL